MQNPPHLLLADSQRLEAGQYVADSARPPLLVFALEAQYLVSLDARFRSGLTTRFPAPWLEACTTVFPELRQPFGHRGPRHPECPRHVLLPCAAQSLFADSQFD